MNMSMFALNSDFLQELLCLTQAIQLYTESVQGGIPQRNANPPGILFLLLNAKVFLGIDDLLMRLLMVELLSPMHWRRLVAMGDAAPTKNAMLHSL